MTRAAEGRTPRVGQGQVVLGAGRRAPVAPRPEQIAHIYRLSDPALAELPVDLLLHEVLTRVKDGLGVDTVAILLRDENGTELLARAAKGLEEEVERKVRIPIGKGFAGRIASQRLPIYIADVTQADIVNPILREKGIHSVLGVPLIVEGDLLGVLHVGTLQPRAFTDDDAAVLQLAAARIAPVIERARLYEALERQHRGAVALQRSLLPERLPEIAGVPVAARYFPARDEVGGDWYDVIELPRGDVGIAIGDVAGHGVRAASLMGQLRTAMRAYALEGHGPAKVLQRLDRLLQSIRGRGMATSSYATFDPESGSVTFASAGHPPPAILKHGGEVRLLEISPGAPLGALPYQGFTEGTTTLEAGDIFLFYTDGLIELRKEPLDVGLARLLEAMRGADSAEQICQQVTEALVPHEGANDDIAFVAVQSEVVSETLLLRLPAEPATLAQVRQAVRRWLRARGADDEEVDMVTLACGEACANAIEHAYSPGSAIFEVEGRVEAGEVLIAVRDLGRWRAPRGSNRGRGLTIIDEMMDAVDVKPTQEGTEVLMRRRLRAAE
jgi:anti-sigma regulatory factor (Ser/Thr protein kinase)/putative methionine-R-sulfoxide reductase with GAF domain